MNTPSVRPIRLAAGGSVAGWRYRICDCPLLSDRELPPLNCWRTRAPRARQTLHRAPARRRALPVCDQPVYRDSAWLGQTMRAVTCWSDATDTVLRLRVGGVGDFWIDGDAQALIPAAAPGAADADPLLTEMLLGPGLILLLAFRRIFCLHASAVSAGNGAVAFLGESGQGKSTLARAALNGLVGQTDWRRVGDDILPFALEGDAVHARPHFPQLKLESGQQYPPGEPARLPLRHIFLLSPQPPGDSDAGDSDAGDSDACEAEPLTPSAATLALVRHTVAVRLFPKTLLSAHLRAMAEVAALVPVTQLRYPKSLQHLPALIRFIRNGRF